MADNLLTGAKNTLLGLSDEGLDPAAKAIVLRWTDPAPTALQVLEALDACIHGSLCSNVVVVYLEMLYDVALAGEGKTHQDMEPLATWRAEI